MMRAAHPCALLLLWQFQSDPPAFGQDAASTATGISRSFNPAISANGLFLAAYDSEDGAGLKPGHGFGSETGMRVQEVEMQISAFVDPYLKADLIFALPGGEEIELEEGFVTTQGLPLPLTVKVGKFFADLGRHNLLHAHQFPFLDAPLVHQRLLGDEGLNEAGIGVSLLLPTPWFTEVSGQVFDGDNELFASEDGEDLLYVGHLRNFVDMGESATLELGGSFAAGNNRFDKLTSVVGGDLTLKWRSLRRSRGRGLIWQSEYLYSRQNLAGDTKREGGLYSLVQFQFARRWWIQGRYDLFGLPKEDGARVHRGSALLAFVPSEFSALRLQYNHLEEDGKGVNQLFAQLNFTIGSHPAHRY